MNTPTTPTRRPVLILLLAAAVAIAVAGCAHHPRPTPVGQAEHPRGTLALPVGTAPTALGLPAGGSTQLRLPTGPPLRLELPPGTTATIDLTGQHPAIVITIADAALGFDQGADTPKDPVAANKLIAHLVATLASTHATDHATITVTGYASAEGTTNANQQLSTNRARWVCASLTTAGIPTHTLTCTGKGETHDLPPLGPGPEDRRVELHIQTTQP